MSANTDRQRAVLQQVEWIRIRDESGEFYWTCPCCWADREIRGGHTSTCELERVIREWPRVGPEAGE